MFNLLQGNALAMNFDLSVFASDVLQCADIHIIPSKVPSSVKALILRDSELRGPTGLADKRRLMLMVDIPSGHDRSTNE
jgi:hypothetical protein